MSYAEMQELLPVWELHNNALAVAIAMRRPFTRYKAVPYGDKLREPIRCGWYKGQEF